MPVNINSKAVYNFLAKTLKFLAFPLKFRVKPMILLWKRKSAELKHVHLSAPVVIR